MALLDQYALMSIVILILIGIGIFGIYKFITKKSKK